MLKKTLSMMLTVAMLFGTLSAFSINVNADSQEENEASAESGEIGEIEPAAEDESDPEEVSETDQAVEIEETAAEEDDVSAPVYNARSATTVPVITGIWDPNGAAIDFAEDGATIGYTGDLTHPEIKKVRVIASFPAGSTDQVLRVKLAEGIVWNDNGATGTPSLVSVSGPVGNTTVGGTAIQDGEYTYNIANGTTTFTLEFDVKYDNRMDMVSISDAITVNAECQKDGNTLEADELTLGTLERTRFDKGLANSNHLSQKPVYSVKPGEVSNSDRNSINVVNYFGNGAVSIGRFITNMKITVVADADLVYKGLETAGTSIACMTTTGFDNNNQPVEAVDNGDGTITYTFVKSITHSGYVAGFKGNWQVPADAEIGHEYKVDVTRIEYSLYGNDTPYVYEPSGYYTYTVIDNTVSQERVTAASQGYTVSSHPSQYEVSAIGAYCIYNDGIDTTTPKLITYHFPEGLHILAVDMPGKTGNTNDYIKRVDYKLAGSDEWVAAEVNVRTNVTYNMITMEALGLSDDDRVSDLRIYYEFANPAATGTEPYEVSYGIKNNTHSDCGWGHRIYASRDDVNTDSFVTTVDLENLYADAGDPIFTTTNGSADIVPGDHTIVRRKITTTYSDNQVTNMVRVDSSGLTTTIAGSTLSLRVGINSIGASQQEAGGRAATLYPKIYLRDETGSEISNVKLVNSDWVDIMSEYGIRCTLDHTEDNGTKVYVIDTSILANRTDEGRTAAAVGYLYPSNQQRTLVLTYDVNIRSDYNDNSQIHYLSDAIFITNGYGTFTRTASSNQSKKADPYGVDGIVGDEGEVIYQYPNSNNSGTYKIISKDDISVSFMAKRADAEDYEIYNPDSPIQVVADADYNVKVTVANNSGVTTGTSEEQTSYVFIPIPKSGEDWGGANTGYDSEGEELGGFGFTMNLNSAIEMPVITDPTDGAEFTVDYATIDTEGAGFAGMTSQEVGLYIRENVNTWGAFSGNANCVRITAKGLKGETSYDFVMNMTVDSASDNQQMDIYNAMFYENLTTQDLKVYSGIYSSELIGFKVVWGSVAGRVYADNDNSGTYNAGDELLEGVTVKYTNTEDPSVRYNLTTDSEGSYSRDQVNTGTYSLTLSGYDTDKYTIHEDVPATVDLPQVVDDHTVYEITQDIPLVPSFNVTYHFAPNGEIPAGAAVPSAQTDILAGTDTQVASVAAVDHYTFDGWYRNEACTGTQINPGSTVTMTGDLELYGKWTIDRFTVKFVDEDGTELSSASYAYGTVAADITKPADPTKDATAQYTYTFSGWSPEIAEVTADATYTATYSSTVNEYTVKFVDDDGTELLSGVYAYGTTAANITKPADPTKEATDQYTYTFSGWSPAIAAVTGDATYTATYSDTVNEYTVKFVDEDGTELLSGVYAYGTTAANITKPADPTKEATDQYTYTFSGWSPAIAAVTGDATYTATYSDTVNEYTVKFVDDDGTELSSEAYEYGTAAEDINVPADPTKEATAQYTYTFEGWTPEIAEVTADATYTAVYSSTVNAYAVTYHFVTGYEAPGAVLPSSTTLDYGTEYTAEDASVITGYTFDGWYTDEACTSAYVDGTAITGAVDLYGKYTANRYTLVFMANGGEGDIASVGVKYDEDLTLPSEGLTREGCGLIGWSTSPDTVVPGMEAGSSVKNLASNEGDTVTLYAIWERTAQPVEGTDYYVSLDAESYTEGDDITITAVGYWPSETPILGDVKLVPSDWHHDDPSGDWDGLDDPSAAYTATFRQKAGTYTVHVNFVSYTYGASGWVQDPDMKEITVTYKVAAKSVASSLVATGEDVTTTVTVASILIIAGAALITCTVVRARRKENI